MSPPPAPEGLPLLIEPVVAWPHRAETDCDYLVTVDLRGPLPADDGDPGWPYPDEEFTFTVALDGSPHFVCTALDDPSVVLHRFGGTYGPAAFRVSTGSIPGPAALWLTVSNQWGVPVRKAELRSEIWERDPGRAPAAQLAEVVRARQSGPAPHRRQPRTRDAEPSTVVTTEPASVPVRTGAQTVTISYAGFNRGWAAWIADRLERRGQAVALHRWDPPEVMSTADSLREYLLTSGSVLLIPHAGYFRSGPRGHDDWNTALREVVVPNADRFVPVMVTASPLPSAVAALEPVDLSGLGAQEAERRLLIRLGLPTSPLPDDADRSGPRFPADDPAVWGGVPRRNTDFTGRDALLDELGTRLRDAESGTVALRGMSGVGKTQLAAEYIYRFGSEYDVVWWATADQLGTLRERLAQLAPALGLRTGQEYGERIRAVQQALRRGVPHRRWLLVLDSADEVDGMAGLVPSGTGHVLITSRNSDWALHGVDLLEVPLYDRGESIDFIRRRAPRLTTDEAYQLAEALEDLPLLLDQTAGWLNDSSLPVQEYIALLEGGADRDILAVSADFPVTYQTAGAILLNRLRETAPESVDLLRLCAFFSPGSVPVRLLRGVPAGARPEALVGLMNDTDLWDRTIRKLSQYSVARLESQATVLYLHRIVHQVTRQDMSAEVAEEYAAAARASLAATARGRPGDPESWPVYAEIVPHLEYADALYDTDPASLNLVLDCLRYLYLFGEYATGLRLAEQAVPAWQSRLGADHPRLWDLSHHYANLLRAVGDYRHSETVSRSAAERHRGTRNRGAGPQLYLRAAAGLAADLRALGRYEEAYGLSREVCDANEEFLEDENHRDVLAARNNLAVSLRLLGDYKGALDTDRSTLHARYQVLGRGHPWTLLSETFYAIDLRLLGKAREALAAQKDCVERHRAQMGRDHPQTLQAEHNLAMCHDQAGQFAEAGSLFASVRARGEWVVGEDDPLSLILATAHSCFSREHGDLTEAHETMESVVARYERMLGPTHPYVAGAHANKALILRAVGEREESVVLADHASAVMARAVGPGHPWALGCALNAAASAALAGDHETALAMGRDTLSRAEAGEVLGASHPFTLAARIALCADLRATGHRTEADRLEARALDDLAAAIGPDHPRTRAARARVRPCWDFEPLTT
ncbi:FxSxx-COOH system tetratricopeptide repeat protein [Streptomyces sp. NPDC005251]|uniref:FxSxx-COOH system tetratricopeptide repeat protein n=1 Tax=Streptomyces sp. NPDC005251 TaxID=3157166 RepID=UPI0033A4E0A4